MTARDVEASPHPASDQPVVRDARHATVPGDQEPEMTTVR